MCKLFLHLNTVYLHLTMNIHAAIHYLKFALYYRTNVHTAVCRGVIGIH